MHHDKNTSIKFVAEFVGEEREKAPAAAPVRAAELRAAGVAVLWAGIDAAPASRRGCGQFGTSSRYDGLG